MPKGSRLPVRLQLASCAGLALLLAACGGSSGGIPFDDTVGTLEARSDGALFFVDPNQRGQASELRLLEFGWARLVDVYALEGSGERAAEPVMRRAPVRPDLASDGLSFRLESDALGREALVVLHALDSQEFSAALTDAMQLLPRVALKHAGSPPPFTGVARNAALVLRFDDLLAAGAEERAELAEHVRLAVGYPPTQAFRPRVFFDETHGDTLEGAFHPTRVVLDLTVSSVELEDGVGAPPLNPVGLPASAVASVQANVELRVPTREDFGAGQFGVLRNLRGRPLAPEQSFPYDANSPTLDLVRALRSGNDEEPARGFLPDGTPPRLVAAWPLGVTRALPGAAPGDFLLDLVFAGACSKALQAGELLELGDGFLEVRADTAAPDGGGALAGVPVRVLTGSSVADELVGLGRLHAVFASGLALEPSCWVEVDGRVGAGSELEPTATFVVRFNEPMDPRSLDPLESLRLYRGEPGASSTTVATLASADGVSFELAPLLPLDHAAGASESYVLELVGGAAGATDLAGNALDGVPAPLALTLRADAPAAASGGLALRFAAEDEYLPGEERADLRGLFVRDEERGVLRGRPVARRGWNADGTNGLTAGMFALPVGIREPLVPLGSRFQTLWRYVDFGWRVEDEAQHDLDVEGIAFASFSGSASSDFFERFEVRLGHSIRLPDEALDENGVLMYPESGLQFAQATFDSNVLEVGGARPIHPRELGYRVRPADLFVTSSGVRMLPLPLDRGGRTQPFVWRDTSLLATGGLGGGGIPLEIEKQRVDASLEPGSLAPAGLVPSIGLPLLTEVRCFPSDTALGQNSFQVAIPALGQLFPTFRVHSTGGVGPGASLVRVDPDRASVPSGGFNPSSNPPGRTTRPNDPAFYLGQLDTVTRITRVHTVWFDTQSGAPDYLDPLVKPAPAEQPSGTAVVLEFRGATGFQGTGGAERDAARLDAYGQPDAGFVLFPASGLAWSSDVDALDGLRYVQVRLTFTANTTTGLVPTLDSLALAWRR